MTGDALHGSPERVLHVVGADAVGVAVGQHQADESIRAAAPAARAIVEGRPSLRVPGVGGEEAGVDVVVVVGEKKLPARASADLPQGGGAGGGGEGEGEAGRRDEKEEEEEEKASIPAAVIPFPAPIPVPIPTTAAPITVVAAAAAAAAPMSGGGRMATAVDAT